MPELVVTDGEGNLIWTAAAEVRATCFYPHDEERREQWLAAYLAKVYVEARSELDEQAFEEQIGHWSGFHHLIPLLYEAKQPPKRILADGFKRRARGALAGDVLLFRLACAVHYPQYTDKQMSVAILSEYLAGTPTFDSTEVRASESTLEKAWPEFEAVAHLHAAMNLMIRESVPYPIPDSISPAEAAGLTAKEEDVLALLARSEYLRKAAEEKRILNAETTWRTPPDLKVPRDTVPIARPSEEALEFLARNSPGR